MADIKISALTGATTPLAGTEVLPIVQGSTTVKVSVANLTAGRAIAMAGGTFTDNLIQGTAAKGVNFTANTPKAGMTSQLLNWYEEGTWTPAQGPEVTVVGTYSSSGKYTRVGRLVTVHVKLQGSTSISCTAFGRMVIDLPFTVAAGPDAVGSMWVDSVSTALVALASQTTQIIYSPAAFSAPALIAEFTVTYLV